MGNAKLWLLVLLASGCTIAQDAHSEKPSPTCSNSIRFKQLKKYVYIYEAETSNGVAGTADSQSGSKITCKVDLEVPQVCSFILRINQCTLREVYGVNSEGQPILKRSKNSDEFSNAMSKYELKFSIPDGKQVLLYPEKDEPVNILNIKRGIISALVVPVETEDTKEAGSMDTVYGKCTSEIEFKSKKGNIATEVTINRNLQTCDKFSPSRDYASPIALIKGLNSPLSKLISSTQSCKYTIDAKRRHVSEAVCTERHLFLPFSYKNQYGINAQVKQTLKFEESPKINSRNFDEDASAMKGLALESADDKLPLKSGDSVLKILQELQKLSVSEQNQQRANLFHQFVTGLRGLQNETLGSLIPKMMETSSPVTLQALLQCGTPECFSAILQTMRSGTITPVVANQVTYIMGLLPSPCPKKMREVLTMAQYQQNRATFYGLVHTVNNFYRERGTVTDEVKDVSNFMISMIGSDCSGDQDKTYLTLKAIGNMGKVMEDANPQIKSSLLKCIRSQTTTILLQKAAIQAFRKMSITDEVRGAMLQTFQDSNAPAEKRLTAYLMLMKNPSQSDLNKVTRAIAKDKNEQVKSYVASHIANILNSVMPETRELKGKIEEALKGSALPAPMDFRKFSRNYQISRSISVPGFDEPVAAKVGGNLLFDSSSYMPTDAMLEATLNIFGHTIDVCEFGLEGKGFEPTLEALFGQQGFFPNSAMKALYWMDGRVPEKVTEILYRWFGVSKKDKQNQDLMREIALNVEKLIKDIRSSDAPEANFYMRILGEEIAYLQLEDYKIPINMLLKSLHASQELPSQIIKAIQKGTESDLFVHYIFMDNELTLPTGAGFQLQVSMSGIVTPGAKAGLKIQTKNMQAEVAVKPAVAVEFVTHMGVYIPEVARNGIQMNSNIYHESGIEAYISVKEGQFKFSIPAPKTPTKIFSISNKLNLVSTMKTEAMPSIVENRESSTSCRPLFVGLNYCVNIGYSNASFSDAAPYYPLTGETRYEIEIQPTGEVQEYSTSANYQLQKEGIDLIDILKLSAQAEGTKTHEATLTIKYNRNKVILTSDVEVPDFGIAYGVNFKATDESSRGKKSYTVVIDVTNQKIPEVTLTGQLRYSEMKEVMVGATLSIPRLKTEVKTQATQHYSTYGSTIQFDSSATIHRSFAFYKINVIQDEDKVEINWNFDTSSDLKNMISKLPSDFGMSSWYRYPETVQSYASEILDHNIANTDMNLKHIFSQSLVSADNWLERTAKNYPYTATVKEKLQAVREMNFQNLGLPSVTFPEELFLKSDGSIKYLFNKETLIIDMPLPFGGKSSEDLKVPKTIRSPSLNMEIIPISLAPQELQIPPFIIPKYYKLRVPLLGVLDASTNLYSNYYNWSASYKGGNTTKDEAYTFNVDYQIKADSTVDLLSYNTNGNAALYYVPETTFSWSIESSLHHRLLDSRLKLHEIATIKKDTSKGTYEFNASSVLGAEASISSSVETKLISNSYVSEANVDGKLKIGSLFAKTVYNMKYEIELSSLETKIESNLIYDSSYLQATNKINGRFSSEAIEMISATDVQHGTLFNEILFSFDDKHLTLKCDTKGQFENLVALNKIDLSIKNQMASIRSQYQVDYKYHKYVILLSGSLNSNGLEFNTDINFNNRANRAAHKATLRLNQNGLATSATTNINYSPLNFGKEFNAGIDTSGATMKVTANGLYREHNAKLNMDGKITFMEISLGSVYQSTILGLDNKNILHFKMNKDGLKFSNSLVGSYNDMKLELNKDLSVIGTTMVFSSKFENIISAYKSYKQNFDLQIQPFMLSSNLNNEFKYDEIDLSNKGQLQLELLKISLNGDMRGAYKKDEIKHTYTFSYAEMTTNFKTNTVANIQGKALTNRVNVEIAGLSAAFSSSTNCDSKSLRFNNVVTSVILPFTITVDAHTSGDGRLMVWGDHTGQLYSKFLFKAEPLALTFSHDYRGSTEHTLDNGDIHKTLIDNKVNALLNPSKQSGSWKLKSQLDKTAYLQDASAYNNAEKIGIELNGEVQVDLSMLDSSTNLPFMNVNLIDALNLRDSIDQPQEFSISGSVIYDKNQDVHVINLPCLENLPIYFEQIRRIVLSSLQAIQNYLKNINIDQYIKTYIATLDKIPQQMNDYINKYDLEGKIRYAKEKLIVLIKDYRLTVEDLNNVLNNVQMHFRTVLSNLQEFLKKLEHYIREDSHINSLRTAIENFINEIVHSLKYLDESYGISINVIKAIQDLQKFVDQFDVNQFGFNEIERKVAHWLQNMDKEYKIKDKIKEKLQQLKNQIENIDLLSMAENFKSQLQAFKITEHIENLIISFPTEKVSKVIEQVKDFLITLINDYEVVEKINAIGDKIQALIVKFEVDKQFQAFMDKLIEMVKQYKVKERIKKITKLMKSIDVKSSFDKIVTFVDDGIKQIRSYDYKKLIDDLNRFLDMAIKKLKSFDYNELVDSINEKIRQLTQKINDEIKALEIPQNAEALKQYMKDAWLMTLNYMEKLKNTRFAILIEWFRDLLNSTALNELKKRILENLEDLRDTVYTMDIQKECQQYLLKASQLYNQIVTYISDQWNIAAEKITKLGGELNIKDWAENVKTFVETGFIFPEIRMGFINIPAFEVSLRALREATFQTPNFIVPLTNLHIKSVTINMNKLKDIRIPTRFTTPEFIVLNTYIVPAYTIDLNEIKQKIVNIIDQMMSSEFQWPSSEVYMGDLTMNDLSFPDISFPEIPFPDLQVPTIIIPKLTNLQIPDIQIPEFQLPRIPHTISVPMFGKFTGALKVTSPFFTLRSASIVQNTTVSAKSPEFLASLSAQTTSNADLLAFTLDADARISAPNMAQLLIKKSFKVAHKCVKIDHNFEVTFSGTNIIGKAKTLTSLRTEKISIEVQNDMTIKLEKKITVDMNTKYLHKLNIPQAELSSQLEFQNEVNTLLEAGTIAYSSLGRGNWKWTYSSFSDEGTHESNIQFSTKGPIVKISGSNKILDKYLKLEQSLNYESGFLRYGTLEIISTAESPHVGLSVLNIKAKGLLNEMKIELEGTHKAELAGRAIGTINNTLSFLMQPFEIHLSTINNGNLKVSFPLKLIGKIEFINNYISTLSSAVQQVRWQANGRFNQYKYSHSLSAGNNAETIDAHVAMNGEANLDFLTQPITIPAVQIPYIGVETLELKDISLWEKTGLKNLLRTTKQTFDLSVRIQYQKNKEMHALPFPLAKVYDSINHNIKSFNKHFEKGRDYTLDFLTDSYNKAKEKFDKYNIENSVGKLPRHFRFPGYTIPVLNVEVSPFTAELPEFGYIIPKEVSTPSFMVPGVGFSVPSYTLVLPSLELPVLHVPNNLRKLSLPRFKLPRAQNNILIPAMGNLTYEFSFKSNVISLNKNAGLFNQTDISARFSASSTSVFEALQFTLDGTTSLSQKRGLKLATGLSLKNVYLEGNHESYMTLTKKNMEASVTTNGRINMPILKMIIMQKLSGNTKSKPTVSSEFLINYEFTDSKYNSKARGLVDHKLKLEGLTSYFSLETSTKADIVGAFLDGPEFTGKLNKEASTYLSANGVRSSIKLEGYSKLFRYGTVAIKQNLASEISTRRIYAIWEHSGENDFSYLAKGNQNCKVMLDMTAWNLATLLELKGSQRIPFLEGITFSQTVSLKLNTENQELIWTGQENIQSVIINHDIQLENNKKAAQLNITGSLQGHMKFLKSIELPPYDKSIWDILKFDLTTRADQMQSITASSMIVFTKNKEGLFFPVPVNKLADGFVITIPELNLIKVPKMFSSSPFDFILPSLPNVRFPKVDFGTKYTVPKEFEIPSFEVMMHQFEITISQFSLPKSIFGLNFNDIANFDLPTITIPEQKIEIPPLKISLPGGLFIPAFGNLSGAFKFASPIYTVTWYTTLKNTTTAFESSIDATCSSTLRFLEYDLDVVSTTALQDSTVKINEKGSFSHPDLSITWQQDLDFRDLWLPSYTITADIISPTFVNAQIRYEYDKNKISSSMSSPSAGVLGLLIEKDASILQGKLYSQYPSSPERDIIILKYEISLRDPEQIQIKTSWEDEAVVEILTGLKGRIPKISDAIYDCINKYHHEHFGIDMKTASLRIKQGIQNVLDRAHFEAVKNMEEIDQELRKAVRGANEKYQMIKGRADQMYQDAEDQAFVNYKQLKTRFFDASINIIQEYQRKVKSLINAAIEFLRDIQFYLPDNKKVSFEERLKKLSDLVEDYFQQVEKITETLKTKSFEDFVDQTKYMYNDAINTYYENLGPFLENVQFYASYLQEFSQLWYQDLLDKLEQSLIYVKALREEYLDPNVVGWTVKYYEIEEKLTQWLKYIIQTMKDLNAKYIGDSAKFLSNLTHRSKEFLENYRRNYYNRVAHVLTDAEVKGKQKMTELTSMADEMIQDWSSAVKRDAAYYTEFITVKLQDTYAQFYDTFDTFAATLRRFIDVSIETYHSFLHFITQLIQNIQTSLSNNINIVFRKGELKVDVPNPFEWQSFDEMPRLKDDVLSKRMEIVRALVQDGIGKGSEKWGELLRFIDKQLAEGKLNVEQIIENIRKRAKS
uniref:Apolipoprotein B-100 n=1 Tax=Geotrypetes seraphini TaxID=260995 RepID=A0A6P8QAJ2_GEOSA|nr:apolipoprotein B-100 [Geotrypetes seraphini]